MKKQNCHPRQAQEYTKYCHPPMNAENAVDPLLEKSIMRKDNMTKENIKILTLQI